MKITFLGASKEVTGSCYYIEVNETKFLVDCGLFQGNEKKDINNEEEFPFYPSELDFVLLTHAHIDHSGRLPLLYKRGFKGKIITTNPTKDLCALMLPDTAYIQQSEAEWKSRKNIRAGKERVEPLYSKEDAYDTVSLFRGVEYDELVYLSDHVKVIFKEAGHILGSAIIEIYMTEQGITKKFVFSGDLGNKNPLIIRDSDDIWNTDYLLLENTYGNRLHKNLDNKEEFLQEIIEKTVSRGGRIVIPSFAVERTQEILYVLNKIRNRSTLCRIPVFVDSPLAINATQVFQKYPDYFDEETSNFIKNGNNPFEFEGLQYTREVKESVAINDMKESFIVISASGMCEAGRIKHHLKHSLWSSKNSIIFVGFQALGTLGRKLIEGEKTVKLFGETVAVNAEIHSIQGFSGHADKNGLLQWLDGFKDDMEALFLVHGEEDQIEGFKEEVEKNKRIKNILVPKKQDIFNIDFKTNKISNVCNEEKKNHLYKLRTDQIEKMRNILNNLLDDLYNDLGSEETKQILKELHELKRLQNNANISKKAI